ncbi:MAG: transporter [Vicinamibacterales bacterium]
MRPTPLSRSIVLTLTALVALAGAARAQSPSATAPSTADAQALPANDDVTDGTDTTDVGLLQVELGGVFTHGDAATRAAGTPLTLRYGAFEWLELSVGTDGYLAMHASDSAWTSGIGNTQLGARVRLFAGRGGLPIVSLLPAVVLPTASASKGLGSGDVDATLAALTGRDLPRSSHMDLMYGAGAIGAGDGSHFAQHVVSVSGTLGVTRAWTPGLTLTWVSRQDPSTGRALTASADSVVTLSRRLAFDVSATVGVNRDAPDLEIAAGLSVVVGELDLDDGVHARRHRLRLRPKRRPRHRVPDPPGLP